MKRLEINDVRKEFDLLGLTLISKEYLNTNQKLTCENKDGYKMVCRLKHLKSGHIPSPFSNNNPYIIENINRYLKISGRDKNVKLLSTEYKNVKSKLKFLCLIDNFEFETSWLSFYYQETGCPKCGGTLKYTIDEIKEMNNNLNPYVEIISNKYINSSEFFLCNCKKHNKQFESNWRKLRIKQISCSDCVHEKLSENTYFRGLHLCGENSPSWKGGITPLSNYLRDKINQWKQDSFKKYNFTCDITGSTKNLIIHHFHNFSDILRETMENLGLPIYEQINKYTDKELELIENKCLELHYKYGLGVCLCKEIHDEFHKIYGKYNNSIEQYKEFKNNELLDMEEIN